LSATGRLNMYGGGIVNFDAIPKRLGQNPLFGFPNLYRMHIDAALLFVI